MIVLLDMNLSPRWVTVLAGLGIEAVHWSAVGNANDPDTSIIAIARQFDYILLTHDPRL